MDDLEALVAQRDDLQRRIDAIEAERHAGRLVQAREALAALGVDPAELVSVRASRSKARRSNALVRYRNSTGNTWTGRGKQPRWLRTALAEGHTLADFLVT